MLLRLGLRLPDSFLVSPPVLLLKYLLKGAEQGAITVGQLKSVLNSLSPQVVRSRLNYVARISVADEAKACRVPVCVIRSIIDLAVAKSVSKELVRAFEDCQEEAIHASHFLIQSRSKETALLVEKFVQQRCIN